MLANLMNMIILCTPVATITSYNEILFEQMVANPQFCARFYAANHIVLSSFA